MVAVCFQCLSNHFKKVSCGKQVKIPKSPNTWKAGHQNNFRRLSLGVIT